MQTFKIELLESARVEIYIASNIINYIRNFEGLLQRITVLVDRHQSSADNLLTSLEDLTEKRDRIIWNISNCRTKLNESRVRYVEIQASLSECEAIIEKTATKI